MNILVSEKVITLFLIVFAGIYARKLNITDAGSTKKLSALLLNITQPLLIITSFQIDFDAEKLKEGAGIFILSAVNHVFFAAAVFFLFKPVKNFEQYKVYQMSAVFCNCAFLGFPVLQVVFGDELGVFYGAFYSMFFNIFIWTYGVYLISKRPGKDNKLKFPVKKIFLNAGMVSSVAGIILFALKIKMPAVLFNAARLTGDMTFPLAMIIIGSLIYDIKLKDIFTNKKNYYFLFIKLLLFPAVVLCGCILLNLPRLYIYMGTLMAAMPSAANAAIFAETYDSDAKCGAANVGFSTLVSIGSIPFVIWVIERVTG
ncbi:MAG: AEC family transporter [Oscillospiraceae bacterium]|nr:AEC family transporter [Oscillospiraceae bacterium]